MSPDPKVQWRDHLTCILYIGLPFAIYPLQDHFLQTLAGQKVLCLIRTYDRRPYSGTEDRFRMVQHEDVRRLVEINPHDQTDHTPQRGEMPLRSQLIHMVETRLEGVQKVLEGRHGCRVSGATRQERPRGSGRPVRAAESSFPDTQ